jgi:hypothetical protein
MERRAASLDGQVSISEKKTLNYHARWQKPNPIRHANNVDKVGVGKKRVAGTNHKTATSIGYPALHPRMVAKDR